MSNSRNKVNNGDIFVLSDIKLQDEIIYLYKKNRLAKVIFISKKTKLMIAIILSKEIFKEIPNNTDDVEFSDNVFYTGSQLLKSGDWKVIGNQPVTESEKNLTLRIVGNSLYLLDEYLGIVSNNEKKRYKKQLISGIGALYYKINEIY